MPNVFVFPKNLRQSNGLPRINLTNPDFFASYPSICFQYVPGKTNQLEDSIYFPMPPGLEISDSMQYDTNFDLGQLGQIGKDLIDAASSGQTPEQMAEQLRSSVTNTINKFKGMNTAAAASIAARTLPVIKELGGGRISDVIDFSTKQMVARNTNTRFQGANIRSFSFKFKMVADSADESLLIKNIVNTFREAAYPGGNNFISEYPGSWKISFLDNGTNNKWLPKLFECYLTSFSSVYNSGTNMWRADSSPIEVDVAMSFAETRALNRADIEELNGSFSSFITAREPRTLDQVYGSPFGDPEAISPEQVQGTPPTNSPRFRPTPYGV